MLSQFSKVIIWGHKLHSHTHSYVHYAFYRAFKHMGAETLWLDNNDDISQIDFTNSFFITEGQTDQKMPLREDCKYLLHNCNREKYQHLFNIGCCFNLQVYTDDVLQYNFEKLEDFIYVDREGRCLFMPWANDLLPYEIDSYKPTQAFNSSSKIIHWVGTIGGGEFGNDTELGPFKKAARENGLIFSHKASVSMEENVKLIKNSYMAPIIVGSWQKRKNYLPCRALKNVAYGQFPVTNSKAVYELFKHKAVYNSDPYQLFYDAKAKLESLQLPELIEQINFVKEHHTYINRINTILSVI